MSALSSRFLESLLLLFLLNSLLPLCTESCVAREREALLEFRRGLEDDGRRLSSWEGDDCCAWFGVACHNTTGHIVKLNLSNPDSGHGLMGKLSPSLLQLKELTHLDLSYNSFPHKIPKFIGSFHHLKYLNLRLCSFYGLVPHELGNLTNLLSLDLSQMYVLSVDNLRWLSHLSLLTYLNMGGIDLSKSIDWLHYVNKLKHLSVLGLDSCYLTKIPPSLPSNNLTSLVTLVHPFNSINMSVPAWFCNLTALAHLDLNHNSIQVLPNCLENLASLASLDLKQNMLQNGLPETVMNLCNLLRLDLGGNYLQGRNLGFLENSTGCLTKSLEILDLTANGINGSFPTSFCKFSLLRQLHLDDNSFSGGLPECIGQLSKLAVLSVSSNSLDGILPTSLCHLSSLKELHLHQNSLSGRIPECLGQLSQLAVLSFSFNCLEGPFPTSLCQLNSLENLYLNSNNLSGPIPQCLGQLSKLNHLSLRSNSLWGVVTEAHLANLSRLQWLDMTWNSLSFYIHSDWVPPFKLRFILLGSCKQGPKFPAWLKTQDFAMLDISNSEIADVVPDWFWKISSQSLHLNISKNKIRGRIPNEADFSTIEILDMSSNNFEGPLPHVSSNAVIVDLSKNSFSGPLSTMFDSNYSEYRNARSSLDVSHNLLNGSITSFICVKNFDFINLSNNQLSGKVPQCWHGLSSVKAIDLENNNLTGEIPNSMGSLHDLALLRLNNNHFTGYLPSSFKNLTHLAVLDLSNNKLRGKIPSWIGGSLPNLVILCLSRNTFYGEIPPELSLLGLLQVLDLSHNNLSGKIPKTWGEFPAMILGKNVTLDYSINYVTSVYDNMWQIPYTRHRVDIILVIKGRVLAYSGRPLRFLTGIDVSSNNLSGEIPREICKLKSLHSLNLSGNQLIGRIPRQIENLSNLESLDLSRNWISGSIPNSISTLYFLSYLNLSYNNLSGEIPTGAQLGTLEQPSIYVGNPYLCGLPLVRQCSSHRSPENPGVVSNDGGWLTWIWLYIGMAQGFALGFCGLMALLVLNKNLRIAYFRFFDALTDKIIVSVILLAARIQKLRIK